MMLKKKNVDVPRDTTLYVIMVRCLQCWHINDGQANKCSQCGHTFLRGANDEEREDAMDRLDKMKAKANDSE